MLHRLHQLGLVLALVFAAVGCGGGSSLLTNFTFDYKPEFSSYTGGVGVTSPLAGVWKINFSRAVGAGGVGEIRQATNYEFVAQATGAGKALGFTLHPENRAATYFVLFLTGSAIDVRVYEYNPRDDRVTRIIAKGTFDLGLREVSTTSYSVEIFDSGGKRDGTGTWSGFGVNASAPGFNPLADGALNGVKFVLTDEEGQGDLEAHGSMNLTIAGTTLTGTATVEIVNNEGVSITDGTLQVSGSRVGGASGGVFNLAISGSVGGVPFAGSGVLTGIERDEETRFGPDVLCGKVQLQSENVGGSIIRARKYSGPLGRSSY